jgi:hypothetical protein
MITIAITRIERKVWIGSLVILEIEEKKVSLVMSQITSPAL